MTDPAALFRLPGRVRAGDPRLLRATEQAAAALAALDEATDGHPLLAALLYRARLDEWHLAATLEGLHIRLDDDLRIIDRCDILDSAQSALRLHQWLAAPSADQEEEIRAAELHLGAGTSTALIVDAGVRLHSWLEAGGTRPPIRAALVRYWRQHRLLRSPIPITGVRVLAADAPEDATTWVTTFCESVAEEARDYRELLRRLQREWMQARGHLAGRRSTSRAGSAIDVLAAAPLISATTLAEILGMSVKGALCLLEDFVSRELVVEVSHRSARRLFGLAGMAPLGAITAPPRRAQPGRGRGRPRLAALDEGSPCAADVSPLLSGASAPPPRLDYAALDAALAHADRATRQAMRVLAAEMRAGR